MNGKREMEKGASAGGVLGFNHSAMRLDDRAHDRQAHPKPFRLGGEERSEEALAQWLRNATAMIKHTYPNRVVAIRLRRNHDFTVIHRRVAHSVETVD